MLGEITEFMLKSRCNFSQASILYFYPWRGGVWRIKRENPFNSLTLYKAFGKTEKYWSKYSKVLLAYFVYTGQKPWADWAVSAT